MALLYESLSRVKKLSFSSALPINPCTKRSGTAPHHRICFTAPLQGPGHRILIPEMLCALQPFQKVLATNLPTKQKAPGRVAHLQGGGYHVSTEQASALENGGGWNSPPEHRGALLLAFKAHLRQFALYLSPHLKHMWLGSLSQNRAARAGPTAYIIHTVGPGSIPNRSGIA